MTIRPQIFITYDGIESESKQEAFNKACKMFREEYEAQGFIDIDNPALDADEIREAGK